jgi:pyrroline-5-carboxylate reductase
MKVGLIGNGHFGHAVTDKINGIEVSKGRGQNAEIAEISDILFLTVQPSEVAAVLEEIKGRVKDSATIMSFVGAVPKEWIEQGTGVKVVRGMTNISFQEILSTGDLGILHELSDNVRLTDDERNIDRHTCLVGCMPGVAAHQLKNNADAEKWLFEYSGFVEDKIGTSRNITAEIIDRVRRNGDYDAIIKKVATEGGFTEAMLEALAKNAGISFDELLKSGMLRADEIIKALSKRFKL